MLLFFSLYIIINNIVDKYYIFHCIKYYIDCINIDGVLYGYVGSAIIPFEYMYKSIYRCTV